MPDIDFSSISAQVQDYVNNQGGSPSPAPDPAPQATPDPQLAADPAGSPAPVAPEDFPVDQHLDKLVTVKIDGKTERVPLREALSGYSRTADYTRKTQELATQRQQVEQMVTSYMQEREQLAQFLNNKELVAEYARRAFGLEMPVAPQPHAQAPNPGDIPTVAEVQQMLQSNVAEVRNWAANYIAQVTAEAETRTQAAQITGVIQDTMGTLLQDPLLQSIPKADVLIRRMAQEQNPANVEELRVALRSSADELKASIQRQIDEAQKRAVVGREKLVNKGIEPPGGQPLTPQPKTYVNRKAGSVDWNAIRADVESSLKR
jgi:hypothetical protein